MMNLMKPISELFITQQYLESIIEESIAEYEESTIRQAIDQVKAARTHLKRIQERHIGTINE
jgi:hypothetical protein